jgi:hypothetical protein
MTDSKPKEFGTNQLVCWGLGIGYLLIGLLALHPPIFIKVATAIDNFWFNLAGALGLG